MRVRVQSGVVVAAGVADRERQRGVAAVERLRTKPT